MEYTSVGYAADVTIGHIVQAYFSQRSCDVFKLVVAATIRNIIVFTIKSKAN